MSKHFFRTAASFVAAVLFAFPCCATPSVSASRAILMDADTGEVLFAQNEDEISLIASTTKIMTAVVALEHCALDDCFTVPAEATGIEGSSIYLQQGETLTIRELLYGLMLHSGNDAAVALALACSGSVEEFVALMNLKAQQLGLKNTHFENPNGLDCERHYSTARDLARLTQYALKNEAFVEIVSTKSIQLGSRRLTNHNKLLWSVDGAIGVKTGYTRAAGRILVSAAERNGRRLIAVTINDGNDWRDHKALYAFGFEGFQTQRVISEGDAAVRLPLLDGTTAILNSAESLEYAMREGEQARIVLLYPQIAFSAGAEGTPAGFGAVYIGERRIANIRLLWGRLEEYDGGTLTKNTVGTRCGIPASGRNVDC